MLEYNEVILFLYTVKVSCKNRQSIVFTNHLKSIQTNENLSEWLSLKIYRQDHQPVLESSFPPFMFEERNRKFLSNSRVATEAKWELVKNLNKQASEKRLFYFQNTLKNNFTFQTQKQKHSWSIKKCLREKVTLWREIHWRKKKKFGRERTTEQWWRLLEKFELSQRAT